MRRRIADTIILLVLLLGPALLLSWCDAGEETTRTKAPSIHHQPTVERLPMAEDVYHLTH